MATVYLARHETSGEQVALKAVHPDRPSVREALEREILALSRLDHPGVVRIRDWDLHADDPWYAMDWIEGPTLDQIGPWTSHKDLPQASLARILTILRDVCWILGYLHSVGVVHRDLKPSNIIVSEDDRPVLVDFGLASASAVGGSRETLDNANDGMGTALFMSPEQAEGHAVDGRADLYALGVMLFELLIERPPFDAASPTGVLVLKLTQDAERVSALRGDVDARIDDLVAGLLARAPEDRPTYALDVAETLSEVTGSPAPPFPLPTPYLLRPRLAGRDEDIERCDDVLGNVRQGSPRILLLTGEMGVGKTRLAGELMERARQRTFSIAVAPSQRDTAFSAWRPIVQLAVEQALIEGSDSELLEGVTPWLGRFFASFRTLPLSDDAESAQCEGDVVFGAVCRSLPRLALGLSRYGRLLWLVDDVGQLDPGSRRALDALAEELRTHVGSNDEAQRLLVVLCGRTTDVRSADLRCLDEHPALVEHELGPLDAEGLHTGLASMLGTSHLPEGLVDLLWTQTGGNPHHASEFLTTALAAGLLQRHAGQWTVVADTTEFLDLPLPQRLDELTTDRISRLHAPASRLVDVLAVLGSTNLDWIAEYDDRLLDGLVEARAQHVLALTDDNRVAFFHGAIRDAAYRRLDPGRRRELHGSVAKHLVSASPSELARHWELAGESVRAREAYRRASEASEQQGDYLAAVHHCRAAAEIEGTELDQVEDQLRLAELLIKSSEPGGARQAANAALSGAERIGDELQIGRAWMGIANVHLHVGDLDEAGSASSEAQQHLRQAGQPHHLGRAAVFSSKLEYRKGDLRAAYALCRQAWELLEEHGEVVDRVVIRSWLGVLHLLRDEPEQAERMLRETIELGTAHQLIRSANTGRVNLAQLLQMRGRLDEALELALDSLAFDEASADPGGLAQTERTVASILTDLGRLHEAVGILDRAHRHAEASGSPHILAETLSTRGMILRSMGRYDEARTDLQRSVDIAIESGQLFVETISTIELGSTVSRLDGAEAAESSFRRAHELSSQWGREETTNLLALRQAESMATREPEAALALAMRSADQATNLSTRVEACLLVARLQRLGGDDTAAATALAAARALLDGTNLRVLQLLADLEESHVAADQQRVDAIIARAGEMGLHDLPL